MAIPLIREPSEESKEFGVLERCHFCGTRTTYWHENTNNPVCPGCAPRHKVNELPDYGQRVRSMKRKERYQVEGKHDD